LKFCALKFYENGEMTEEFAFGGSGKDTINADKTYPASLQNFLIDTGSEVILVDTGLPASAPAMPKKPGMKLYSGEKIANFTEALEGVGYKVEDVDKVVLTHKHPDHSGELGLFSHAKIYMSAIEAENMKLDGDNIVKVTFDDGAYKNFEASQKIAENIVMLPAHGHTKGNSILVVEEEGLNYMFHGDITYTDEALRQSKLSVVFEDIELAKVSLDKVRTFVQENDTVYLSTHTPEGVSSLEEKKIMKLS
jgi:N-acyl homoserine lactone hydrolase